MGIFSSGEVSHLNKWNSWELLDLCSSTDCSTAGLQDLTTIYTSKSYPEFIRN